MSSNTNKGFTLLHLSVFVAGFTGVLGRLIELDSAVLVWHRMACIFQFDTRYRLGIALGVVSSAIYALFAIANQHVGKRYEAKNMLLWEMIGGLVVLTALLPIYNAVLPVGKLLLSGMDYPYMAFMVVVCTIGLCLMQIIVLQKIDAFTVNLTYNLEPVYSIVIAMLIFNEYQELNFSFILGIALTIISVALQTKSKLKSET